MVNANLKIAHMNVHYFRYPLSAFVRSQKELGRKHIVFWAGVPHLWVDQYGAEPYEVVLKQLSEGGLIVDAIAARLYNYTLFMDEESTLNMHSMAYYRRMIDLTAEWGVPLLAIELWGALRDLKREGQYQNCRNALRQLCEYAEEKQLKLAVGNVSYSHSAMMNTLSEIKELVKATDCDNLMVALDYGTAWLNRESAAEWIDAFGERLQLLYLSDARNNGSGYPLSKGCCAIGKELEELRRLNFGGIVALRMEQDCCRQDPVLVDMENQMYLDKNKIEGA